jgi:hypothetical protein
MHDGGEGRRRRRRRRRGSDRKCCGGRRRATDMAMESRWRMELTRKKAAEHVTGISTTQAAADAGVTMKC